MNKFFKIMISCVLIGCLMFPTYATLSAADGAAFVTKSEFDSAIADFNSRLTTFESGINSKIDSQVTSYLDRNGIWSGRDQDFVKNSWSCTLNQAVGISNTTLMSVHHNNNTSDFKTLINSRDNTDCLDFTNGSKHNTYTLGTLISDIDKPGLLSITGTYGDGVYRSVGLLRTDSNYGNDGCYVVKLTWKLMKESGGVTSTEWSKTWQWENNFVLGYWVNRNLVYALIPKMPLVAYIFVKRHDKIICEVDGDVLAKGATAQLSTLNMTYDFIKATVY